MNGPELQERLSKLGSTLPIIFLTGYLDIPATVRAIKAGADDFLTKPVSRTFGVLDSPSGSPESLMEPPKKAGRQPPPRALRA